VEAANPEPQDRRRLIRLSLRWKIVGLTGSSMVLLAAILVTAYHFQTRTILEQQLRERGRAIALGLANNLAYAAFSSDKVELQSAAASAVRDLGDVAYVVLRAGNEVAASVHEGLSGISVDALGAPALQATRQTVERSHTVGNVPVLEVSAPMLFEDRARPAGGGGVDPLLLMAEPADAKSPAAAGRRRVGSVQVGLREDEVEAQIGRVATRSLLLGLVVFLGCLGAAFVVARMLTVPLERLAHAAGSLSRGDLLQSVSVPGNDEIAALGTSFQAMADGLRGMLLDLRNASAEVEREASEILSSVAQQSAMATQQASAINETTATVTEIAQTSKQATEHADSVIKIAQKSEELSQQGQTVVDDAMAGMEKMAEQVRAIALTITELSERTLQIGDIIATVKDLAEQSNLLALNASIEAARAGENGRGFAVVAMEMRNLAEQSKLATNQVRSILVEIQKGTRAAVSATEEGSSRAHALISRAKDAGSSIEGLAQVIRESSLAARQIAHNTRQQTVGVEQIVSAITELSSAMSDTAAGSKRIEAGTGKLTQLSKRLSEAVSRYRA
jgi:methyl-accepting chemotaxis protein